MESPKDLLIHLARAGYAARGVVYLIVGFFALLSAFGEGQSQGSRGALLTLLEQPFGRVLVWAMIVGLLGYSLWRWLQAFADADDHGRKLRGLTIRVAFVVSGLTYLTLAVYALSLVGVLSGGGDGGSADGALSSTVAQVVGSRVVSLVLALILLGVAFAHAAKALRRRYARYMDLPEPVTAVHGVAITGLLARGAVFLVLAVLLLYRAISSREQVQGTPSLEAALEFVQGLPFGPWLLALMGLGLCAFALYSFTEARWRRIHASSVPGVEG